MYSKFVTNSAEGWMVVDGRMMEYRWREEGGGIWQMPPPLSLSYGWFMVHIRDVTGTTVTAFWRAELFNAVCSLIPLFTKLD